MIRLVHATVLLLACTGCPAGRGLQDSKDTAPPTEWVTGPLDDQGNRYHVIRVAADPPVAAVIIAPAPDDEPRLPEGHPVLVFGAGGLELLHCDAHGPAYSVPGGTWGSVVVLPLGADECCMNLCGEGENDLGGPSHQKAFLDTVRFATGQAETTDGLTLQQLVPQTLVMDRFALLVSSSYGVSAVTAMASAPEVFATLGAAALYEVPIEPWTLCTALGTLPDDPDTNRDGDGNGCTWDDGRNLRYQPGDCDGGECTLDLQGLAWTDSPHFDGEGSLYLDNNNNGQLDLLSGSLDLDGNGAIDADEDYLFNGTCSTASTYPYCWQPSAILEAAVDQGALDPAAWPVTLPTLELAAEFWGARDAVTALPRLGSQLPDTRWLISAAWRDHGVAQVTRPHVVAAYNLLLSGGAAVCFEPSPEAFSQVFPEDDPSYDRLAWNADLSEANVTDHLLPEQVDKAHAWAITAVDLLDLLLQ